MARKQIDGNYEVCGVEAALGGTRFRVIRPNGEQVVAYMGGKMRFNKISVVVGDRVEILVGDYGTHRIIRRV